MALSCAPCSVAATAPESPVGLMYYESGRTIARTTFSLAVVFKDAGGYQGIYFTSTGLGDASPLYLANLEDGTWTYRKINDTTAELTIRTASGSGPVSGARTLQFSSDTGGVAGRSDFGSGGSTGGLFRLVSQATSTPLTNCSNRSFVRNGGTAFTGFVITDATSRSLLIRAVGPGLEPFGIVNVLKTPQITVRSASSGRTVSSSTAWTDDSGGSRDASIAIRRAGAITGAFALGESSKDSATIVALNAGAYIAEVSSTESADSGEVLIEVYMLP